MANGAVDAPARGQIAPVVAAVALIVTLDQLTKTWALRALDDGPVEIIGDAVELRLTFNSGAAFGRFQGMTPFLALAAILVTVVLVRAVRRTQDRFMLVGLVLVLGGALGNLADRIFREPGVLRGHVVDFVSVGSFPVFNLADSCITIGALVLVLRSLRAAPDPGRA